MVTDDSSLYSMALGILYILRDSKVHEDASQLPLIMDRTSFDNLIDYFGGQKIRIPTRAEVNASLKALVLFQLVDVYGKSALQKANFLDMTSEEQAEVMNHVDNIRYYLGNLNEDILVERKRK